MTTECLHLFAPAAGAGPWGVFHATVNGVVERLPDAADQAALEALSHSHAGIRVIVWVPGSDCLFTSVTISARQLKQAGNALGWLLEEQVGEDVENLHLVQAPQQAGDVVPLLVVADALMDAWLQTLHGAGLRPAAMLPDVLLLPLATGVETRRWTLAWVGMQAWLRTGPWQGAAIESGAALVLLDSALAEAGSEEGVVVQLLGADAATQAALEQWAAERRADGLAVTLEADADFTGDCSPLLAGADPLALSRHAFNLLQGDYAERSARGIPPAWRIAAVFIAVSFCVQLLGEWVGYFYYHHHALTTQTQAVQLYKQLFPQEHRIVSLRKQMDAHLQGGGQQKALLVLLTQFAQGMQGAGLQTQRLDFDADSRVLNIDVDASSLGQLQALKQKLEQQGLAIELSSANAQGSGVRGRFKITAGAA